jgi:ATP-dependent DNA helicase DinG
MNITKDQVERLLDKYINRVYGENFKFRTQQREVIVDILEAFFDAKCNLYLLDAPTGSGKSIIAMVVSGFLSEMKMKGYILASDLMLQTQYEKDFNNHKLDWGSVKGVDNYTCIANGEKFSIGDCKMKNVSYEESEQLMCFPDCGYLFNRKKAIKSPVTLLNYSYWLIQRNYVEGKMIESGKSVPFPKRDFTLCDEAHKLSDIVQNHFSPRLDERSLEKLEKIRGILIKYNIGKLKSSSARVRTVISNLYKQDDPGKIAALLKEFEMQLSEFTRSGESMKDYVSSLYKKTEVPKEWRFNLGLADWAKDMHCKFEDYNHIIANAGLSSMIKNLQGEQLIFNCLDESYMMDRHFHSQAGFKLLMTATMGDPSIFLKTVGATDARYFRMDSHFDYTDSPIYYFPKRRMSLAHKDKTLPWMANKINDILSDHINFSGIIHSGSYDISSKIYESLSDENRKRVLVYQGTQEKELALERFLAEDNLILMGPSILEGLDLSAEKSRFQIFVKVPFPSLGDKFVSAKIDFQPGWYDWKTSSSILQGIGRSIRNDKDWAITYFLDGCLSDLFRRSRKNFPPEFQKRIVILND